MHIVKMHACGNDYCVVQYNPNVDYKELAIKLCNRKIGVGAEGLIVVKPIPLEMLVYNPEGKKELMSGNGIRCFAKYCLDNKLIKKNKLDILTGTGINSVEIVQEIPFLCKVNMGKPNFNNQMIYVTDGLDTFGRVINVNGVNITTYSFFIGGVNTVIFVDDFDTKIMEYAEDIAKYKIFTRHTNVSFVQIVNKTNINVRTYEYGIGWTLASGAGCCAAVVAANKLGLTRGKVKATLELGYLDVELGKKDFVYLTGPAKEVFSCNYNEEEE